jgi:hypothetical protein
MNFKEYLNEQTMSLNEDKMTYFSGSDKEHILIVNTIMKLIIKETNANELSVVLKTLANNTNTISSDIISAKGNFMQLLFRTYRSVPNDVAIKYADFVHKNINKFKQFM